MTIALPEVPVHTASHTKWDTTKYRTDRADRAVEPTAKVAEPPTERPFQLSVVFTTTDEADAEGFRKYVRDNYGRVIRLEPVPNYGSAVSAITCFHYCFPHATESFVRGMYACLTSPHSGLCVSGPDKSMQMYAGQRQ